MAEIDWDKALPLLDSNPSADDLYMAGAEDQRDQDLTRIQPLVEAALWYAGQRRPGGAIPYVPIAKHKALLRALESLGVLPEEGPQ